MNPKNWEKHIHIELVKVMCKGCYNRVGGKWNLSLAFRRVNVSLWSVVVVKVL